jgi:hypothetical protein
VTESRGFRSDKARFVRNRQARSCRLRGIASCKPGASRYASDPQVSINPIAMVAICPEYLLRIYQAIPAQREQQEHLFLPVSLHSQVWEYKIIHPRICSQMDVIPMAFTDGINLLAPLPI